MPDYDGLNGLDNATELDYRSAKRVTQRDVDGAAKLVTPQYRGALESAVGSLGFGVLDVVDAGGASLNKLASTLSLGLIPQTAERGDFNSAVLRTLDLDYLTRLQKDVTGGSEMASGVYAVIASELLARRVTAPLSFATQTMAKLPYFNRIAQLDARYDQAMQIVRGVEVGLAKEASLGLGQYVGRVSVGNQIISRAEAVANVSRIGMARAAYRGAVSEAALGTIANQNSFLYDDNMSWNLALTAVGIGLPAVADNIATKYALRKMASSNEVIRAQRVGHDPSGVETTRLSWIGGPVNAGVTAELAPLSGRVTDNITALQVERFTLSHSDAPLDVNARTLAENRDRLATEKLGEVREEVQKVAVKGLSHDGRTRLNINALGEGGDAGVTATINRLINDDPLGFYGIEQLGRAPEDITYQGTVDMFYARNKERQAEIAARLQDSKTPAKERSKLQSLAKDLQYESRLTPQIIVDGERLPLSEAVLWDGYVPPKAADFEFVSRASAVAKSDGPDGTWSVKSQDKAKIFAVVDNNLAMTLRGSPALHKLNTLEVRRLYRLMDKVVDQLAASRKPINLPAKPNWMQLDAAEEILKRSGGRATVVFPNGLTREQAMLESLAQKAEVFREYESYLKNQIGNGKLTPEAIAARMRYHFNMPKLSAYEMGALSKFESPGLALLRGVAHQSPDEIRKAKNFGDVREMYAAFQRFGDLAPHPANKIDSVLGNSFKYGLDGNGKESVPVIAMTRPMQHHEWFKDNLAERLAMHKVASGSVLVGPTADPFTRELAGALYSNPNIIAAADVGGIRETQFMGAFTGSAPQSARGAYGNAVLTSEMTARDSAPALAASRLHDEVDRLSGNYASKAISEAFGDRLNLLASVRNAPSVHLLDHFHATAAGWDLAKDPRVTGLQQDRYVFPLADTQANRDMWHRVFGVAMPKNAVLTDRRGVVVALDELGMDVQRRFNMLTDSLVEAKNTLLRSQGMRTIEQRAWYVPAPSLRGKFVGFAFGPDGKQIPHLSIIADTQEAYARQAVKIREELDALGFGYTLRDFDSIQRYGSIWDRAISELIDPGTTAIQPGKKSGGYLVSGLPTTRTFTQSVQSIQEQLQRHGHDILQTQMAPSIKAAKAYAAASRAQQGNTRLAGRGQEYKGAYDIYLENLLGRSKLNQDNSLLGQIYNGIEGKVDDFLKRAGPNKGATTEAITGWLARANTWRNNEGDRRDFESLSQALGKYMPFKDAAELADAKRFAKSPYSGIELAGKMSQFTGALVLRFMETAHAIVNFGGIAASMPAVIRHHAPQLGESSDDFLARIGHTGIAFAVGDKYVGTMDMVKVAKEGIALAFKKESHAYYDDMVARGMLSQDIVELHKQFAQVNGRAEWERFMFGDPSLGKKTTGFKDGFYEKGITGWLSVITDKSEDFSRTIASMTGVALAKRLGIDSREQQLSFAHDFANKLIANYSPANRAEVFQGMVGTSIGLFQSFIQNYYQRMFRYAETKDYAAFMNQMLAQTAVFGVPSIPGFSVLDFANHKFSEDRQDATGGLQERANGAADLMQGGLLSNIPTLLGAPSVDYYSRGDVNIRVPGNQLLSPSNVSPFREAAEMAPGMNVMLRIYDGIAQSLAAVASNNEGITSQQLAEILSNMIPNRPMAGIIEQLGAGGYDTSVDGQLVSETTSVMEGIYRVMGVRSMRQSKDIEAFYSSKTTQEHQAAAKEVLRQQMRAAVRDGKMESMHDIFYEQYIERGGDPQYWRRTLSDVYESALETRGERRLERVVKNPLKAAEMERLLSAGVEISNDGEDGFGAAQELIQFNSAGSPEPEADTGVYDPALLDPTAG